MCNRWHLEGWLSTELAEGQVAVAVEVWEAAELGSVCCARLG